MPGKDAELDVAGLGSLAVSFEEVRLQSGVQQTPRVIGGRDGNALMQQGHVAEEVPERIAP